MPLHRHHLAYLADTARVLGDVHLARDVSVWYGAVLRGDVAPIRVGEGTNLQDNVVVHCDSGVPNEIGRFVTVGHGAIVHGRSVGDHSLIGIGARVLDGARIGRGCLVAAGAVVPPGMDVPDGMLVMGIPGRVVRPVSAEERRYMEDAASRYVALAVRHCDHPDDPTVRPYGRA